MASLNALQWYIIDNSLDECATMDRLQLESRTISDCCVTAGDVARGDAQKAVEWLRIQALKKTDL
jgi:hypothetical protein